MNKKGDDSTKQMLLWGSILTMLGIIYIVGGFFEEVPLIRWLFIIVLIGLGGLALLLGLICVICDKTEKLQKRNGNKKESKYDWGRIISVFFHIFTYVAFITCVILAIRFFVLNAGFDETPYATGRYGSGVVHPKSPYRLPFWLSFLGVILTGIPFLVYLVNDIEAYKKIPDNSQVIARSTVKESDTKKVTGITNNGNDDDWVCKYCGYVNKEPDVPYRCPHCGSSGGFKKRWML